MFVTGQTWGDFDQPNGRFEGDQGYSDIFLAKYETLKPDDVIGSYTTANPTNDWHYGNITRDGSNLKWTNRAGKSWTLTPDLQNIRLKTDQTFYPDAQYFNIVLENGKVQGFKFGVADYRFVAP